MNLYAVIVLLLAVVPGLQLTAESEKQPLSGDAHSMQLGTSHEIEQWNMTHHELSSSSSDIAYDIFDESVEETDNNSSSHHRRHHSMSYYENKRSKYKRPNGGKMSNREQMSFDEQMSYDEQTTYDGQMLNEEPKGSKEIPDEFPELSGTQFPLQHSSVWDYLNYDGPIDEFIDYAGNSVLTNMLSDLIENSTCMGNGSVLCCTFTVENSSDQSIVCSNETIYHKEQRNISQCPKHKWKPLLMHAFVPILCALGLCGNTISFLVMCSSAYRRKSYGYYLRALAVFDNLTLIINLVLTFNDATFDLKDFIASNSTYDGLMSFHTTTTCKLTEFMRYVIYLMSSWLVVCFTADRFIAVCFPLLRVRYCTEKSAIYTIAVVLILVMISQTYHLVFVDRLDRAFNPHMPCHAPSMPDGSVRLTYIGINYFWFSFLLRFALPFIAIAVCNGCIIYHIERMRNGHQWAETRRKHKASLAIYTLYAVCACFIITLLPNAIISIIQFSAYFINQQTVDPELYCTLKMIHMPLDVLRLVNYSANCVLYGITGQQFRRELFKLFRCCLRRHSYDKRSLQSPEPIALRADLLSSRKNMNTLVRQK